MFTSPPYHNIPKALIQVCQKITDTGGQAWLVGGCVRDLHLNIPPNDWDMEVYGLPAQKLWQTLNHLGHCEDVGKHFAVTKLRFKGLAIDVALPRTEHKSGQGHCAFDIIADPFIKPQIASLRRDFTINTMMFDPLKQKIMDFHGGLTDLKQKILRHVSPAFAEDPLRPLRAMQFAARFQLSLHPTTAHLCQSLLAEASTLPTARIWQEWFKWAKAETPSFGLNALRDSGWIKLYPELQALITCPQDNDINPWIHTCMVVDAAAALRQQRGLSCAQQLHLTFAALCHDLDFNKATKNISLLRRIFAPKDIKKMVLPLLQEHSTHLQHHISKRAVSQLASRLQPANIQLWEALTQACASGCCPTPTSRPALPWLEQAQTLNIQHQAATPIITGKMLIDVGMQPSADFKLILQQAYAAQLNDEISDQTSAYRWLNKL